MTLESSASTGSATLIGSKISSKDAQNVVKAALWKVHESETTHEGIPNLIQVAFRLRRKSKQKFSATLTLRPKRIDGKSKTNLVSTKSSVVIDPASPPLGSLPPSSSEGNLDGIDLQNLARLEYRPLPEPTMQEGYYIEMWNLEVSGAVTMPIPSTDLNTGHPKYRDLPCKHWKEIPDESFLQRFFPWAKDEVRPHFYSMRNSKLTMTGTKTTVTRAGTTTPFIAV